MSEKTILIVDDDESMKKIFQKMISNNFKANIVLAKNGEEAIKIIRNKTPDLVITDHDMPIMNGSTLINIIREEKISSKIILITGFLFGVKKDILESVDLSLKKPVGMKELLNSVENILYV